MSQFAMTLRTGFHLAMFFQLFRIVNASYVGHNRWDIWWWRWWLVSEDFFMRNSPTTGDVSTVADAVRKDPCDNNPPRLPATTRHAASRCLSSLNSIMECEFTVQCSQRRNS